MVLKIMGLCQSRFSLRIVIIQNNDRYYMHHFFFQYRFAIYLYVAVCMVHIYLHSLAVLYQRSSIFYLEQSFFAENKNNNIYHDEQFCLSIELYWLYFVAYLPNGYVGSLYNLTIRLSILYMTHIQCTHWFARQFHHFSPRFVV